MKRSARILAIAAASVAAPATAITLDFPANAALRAEVTTPMAAHNLASGNWTEAARVPMQRAEGAVTRQAWRIDAAGLTPLQMVAPLRDQLLAEGFTVLHDCKGVDCGGFDFRFALEVMDPPDMYVDLLDYYYLSATRAEDGSAVSLLASRTAQTGFVQVTAVSPPDAEGLSAQARGDRVTGTTLPALPDGDVATQLETAGRAILPDLVFETGSAQLGEGDFPSLDALADYLTANPTRVVALVGHTDSVGSLQGNIALSKRRAGSVRERLIADYGIPRAQLQAEGMGYLSPLATNLTEEGREANRRVEVIMVSTE